MIEYPRYLNLPEDYLNVKLAEFLKEDMPNGDVTTLSTIHPEIRAEAVIEAQDEMVFAGEPILKYLFPNIKINFADGSHVKNADLIAEISAPAAEILTKERVMLNLIQRLSAISTLTAEYVAIASANNVKILDTRKTTPGLRLFEKYAVAVGGGYNHRLDLSSGILIKDNHIQAAGGLKNAVDRVRTDNFLLPIEVEAENFEQVKQAVELGVDGILLDNMTPEDTIEAVNFIRQNEGVRRMFVESSGGINLKTLPDYVKTGIDAVSIGALTHSVVNKNLHLEIII